MFGFLISITVKRNSLYNSLYIRTERSVKCPCSTRDLGPSVILSLFLSLSHPLANSLEHGSLLSSLSCPGFQDLFKRTPLCLRERYKPCPRALLVLCVTQGILASFSLLLSYQRLQTTRFRSIKGPQHYIVISCVCAYSVAFNSLQPHGLYVAHWAPLSMGILQARILE